MAVLTVTALIITAGGVDILTALSGTISALSNIGPGLGEVGPAVLLAPRRVHAVGAAATDPARAPGLPRGPSTDL